MENRYQRYLQVLAKTHDWSARQHVETQRKYWDALTAPGVTVALKDLADAQREWRDAIRSEAAPPTTYQSFAIDTLKPLTQTMRGVSNSQADDLARRIGSF